MSGKCRERRVFLACGWSCSALTCLLRADGVGRHAGFAAAQDVAGNDLEFIIHPRHQIDDSGRLRVAFYVRRLWKCGQNAKTLLTCPILKKESRA